MRRRSFETICLLINCFIYAYMWVPKWEAKIFMILWDTYGLSPFTLSDVFNTLSSSKDTVRVALSRLVKRGWIIRLKRGKYLAKPLDRIVASLTKYFKVMNLIDSMKLKYPIYLYGSVADLLASQASDIDLLIVADENWETLEKTFSSMHVTFVKKRNLMQSMGFNLYLIFKKGIPLTTKVQVPNLSSFKPEKLLETSRILFETAKINSLIYEPQVLTAIGFASKYILYKNGILPPTSTVGAIFELAKIKEEYLKAFKELETRKPEEIYKRVIKWAV
ncbi:MAG: type IV toxin-antitoxin system AbiEi family antitoxin domain-containing protein [Candidatus Baldrarchaeia archaeon]